MKGEESSIEKKYIRVRNIIATLNIFLAMLIIISAQLIINIPFGRIALSFGYGMLTLTLILKILQKW